MSEPTHMTYQVTLTRQEYEFLYRLAPDGIQAAMAATLKITYLEPEFPYRGTDDRRLDPVRTPGQATA